MDKLTAFRTKYLNQTPTLVVYHEKCPDGTLAAAIILKWCKEKGAPLPTFVGGNNRNKVVPECNKDDVVFIVDFSYPRDTLIEFRSKVKSIVAMDHHISAQKDLEGLDYTFYDNDKSGAGIVWDLLFSPDTRPKVVDHVEDRDIWKFVVPNTKQFSAGLHSLGIETPVDTRLYSLLNNDQELYNKVLDTGKILLHQFGLMEKNIVKKAKRCLFCVDGKNYDIMLVNCSSHELISEVGSRLYTENNIDFALMYHRNLYKNKDSCSARSAVGKTDVSEIAKLFGGGGHRGASGFELDNVLDYIQPKCYY